MKLRLLLFTAACVFFAACGNSRGDLSTGIIPAPQQVAWGDGAFRMPSTLLFATNLEGEDKADLAAWMQRSGDGFFPVSFAEAAGDENAFAVAQYIIYILLCQLLGVDPFNIAHGIVCRSGMEKGFRDGQISVMKLNVFAAERYADMALCRLYAAHHRSPLGKIGLHNFNSSLTYVLLISLS